MLNDRFPTVLRCYLNSLLYAHTGVCIFNSFPHTGPSRKPFFLIQTEMFTNDSRVVSKKLLSDAIGTCCLKMLIHYCINIS